MTNELITSLGEAAAKAAIRAIENGERAGVEQNRGQFVAMIRTELSNIPAELRGQYARKFIERYQGGRYGGSFYQD